MAFWKKDAPEPSRDVNTNLREHDVLDSLRMRWLARMLEAGGDTNTANLCLSYAALVDAFNEAKYTRDAYMDKVTGVCSSPDWEHRYRSLYAQLREERRFWREIREGLHPGWVRVTYEDIEWPTDAELLAGA